MEQNWNKIELLINTAHITLADKDTRMLKTICFKIINILKEVEQHEKN